MKWLEKIQQAENINQLPRFAELQEIAETRTIWTYSKSGATE